MASLADIEAALRAADAAGATEDAARLAEAYQAARGSVQPPANAPNSPATEDAGLLDFGRNFAQIGNLAKSAGASMWDRITHPEMIKEAFPRLPGQMTARQPGESWVEQAKREFALPMTAEDKSKLLAITLGTMGGSAPLATAVPGLVARAQTEGVTFAPTQANPSGLRGLLNRALESMAGKASTAQGAAEKNAPILNKLVAGDLKIEGPLSKEAIAQVRSDAGDAYEAVKNVGNRQTGVTRIRFQADSDYQTAIANLGGDYNRIVQEFPELANAEIETLRGSLAKPEMSSTAAVELTKKLRYEGGLNVKSPDPAKSALGRAQLQASGAIDGLMERQLTAAGEPQLAQNLRAARVLIAKTHTADKVIDESSGNVVARKLKAELEKGKPLTGGMRMVAELGQQYPKAVQEIKSSMPGASPLDWLTALTASLGTGDPRAMAMVGARPLARGILLSKPYQSMMLNSQPYNYGPILGKSPMFGALQLDDTMPRAGALSRN